MKIRFWKITSFQQRFMEESPEMDEQERMVGNWGRNGKSKWIGSKGQYHLLSILAALLHTLLYRQSCVYVNTSDQWGVYTQTGLSGSDPPHKEGQQKRSVLAMWAEGSCYGVEERSHQTDVRWIRGRIQTWVRIYPLPAVAPSTVMAPNNPVHFL